LAFLSATVHSSVNGRASLVELARQNGEGRQEIIQGGDTVVQALPSPESSVLLTNNVIHHIAQFAWLHPGEVGSKVELTAFPRVPVTVVLEETGTAARDGVSLPWRRYFLNIANRLGAYVWLDTEGRPLKVSIPLQAFVALSESHRDWSDLLLPRGARQPETEEAAPAERRGEAVRFESGAIALAGTLMVPAGETPHPAAILISGSGPQDRDENSPGPGGLKLGIFRSLANTLTARGIAVLRYDDRGVGESGGDFESAGLSDLVSDVEAAVLYLRGRPDIDANRIALVGHSEGGIIAPIVAAEDERLAAIVLMAGVATPLDSLLMEQVALAVRESGGDSAAVAGARRDVERLAQAIREGRDIAEENLSETYRALARQRKWLAEHLRHDPLATIRKVEAPVLIVNGAEDVQVPPWHAERLGAALAEVGHRDHDVKIFADLNHLFVFSRGEGTAEYADASARVDPSFLAYLADWLSRRLERG
jgi:pimeloyl-ACP methyl ester carboxylesterase